MERKRPLATRFGDAAEQEAAAAAARGGGGGGGGGGVGAERRRPAVLRPGGSSSISSGVGAFEEHFEAMLLQNLRLLGFKDGEHRKIALRRGMFAAANPQAAQAILYFTLTTLGHDFRMVWPPMSNAEQTTFRKNVCIQMEELEKENAIPRHASRISTLMSSQGMRIVMLLYHLTAHAVRMTLINHSHRGSRAPPPPLHSLQLKKETGAVAERKKRVCILRENVQYSQISQLKAEKLSKLKAQVQLLEGAVRVRKQEELHLRQECERLSAELHSPASEQQQMVALGPDFVSFVQFCGSFAASASGSVADLINSNQHRYRLHAGMFKGGGKGGEGKSGEENFYEVTARGEAEEGGGRGGEMKAGGTEEGREGERGAVRGAELSWGSMFGAMTSAQKKQQQNQQQRVKGQEGRREAARAGREGLAGPEVVDVAKQLQRMVPLLEEQEKPLSLLRLLAARKGSILEAGGSSSTGPNGSACDLSGKSWGSSSSSSESSRRGMASSHSHLTQLRYVREEHSKLVDKFKAALSSMRNFKSEVSAQVRKLDAKLEQHRPRQAQVKEDHGAAATPTPSAPPSTPSAPLGLSLVLPSPLPPPLLSSTSSTSSSSAPNRQRVPAPWEKWEVADSDMRVLVNQHLANLLSNVKVNEENTRQPAGEEGTHDNDDYPNGDDDDGDGYDAHSTPSPINPPHLALTTPLKADFLVSPFSDRDHSPVLYLEKYAKEYANDEDAILHGHLDLTP